jgi:hypothetical protein
VQISQPTAPSHTPIITAPATNPSSQSIQPNAPPTGASSSISTAQSQTPSTIQPPNQSQIITLPLSISSLPDQTIQLASSINPSQTSSISQPKPRIHHIRSICSPQRDPTSFPFKTYADEILVNKPYEKKIINYSDKTKRLYNIYVFFTNQYGEDCFEYVKDIHETILNYDYDPRKFDELYQKIDNEEIKKFVKDYFSKFYLFLMNLITDCYQDVVIEKTKNTEFAKNLNKMVKEFNGTSKTKKSILKTIKDKYNNDNEYRKIFIYLLNSLTELRSITALYDKIQTYP